MSTSTEDALMRALHDEHARAVWNYVLRLTGGDWARAEYVTQETLLRARRHPRVLEQSDGSARAWLFTVARRITIDSWRSANSRPEVISEQLPEPASVDESDRAVRGWLVADALAELSQRHREVVVLCYFEGYSVAAAAESLGIAEGTVKSRCHYALRALRLALEEKGVHQ